METPISVRNFVFLLAVIRISTIMIFMPAITVGEAYEDAWIAALVSFIWTLPAIYVFAKLRSQASTEEDGLVLAAKKRLGLYSLIGLAPFVVLCAALSGYFASQLATLYTTVALTETPTGVLMGATLIVAAYAASQGLGVLGRVGQLAFVFSLSLFILILVVSAPNLHLERLQPMLSRGLWPIIKTSWLPAIWTIADFSMVLSFSGKTLHRRHNLLRPMIMTSLATHVILSVAVASVTMLFSAQEAREFLSPAYALAKQVSVTGVVERGEPIILSAWVLAIALNVAFFNYAASNSIAQLSGLRRESLHFPVALASYVIGVTWFWKYPFVKKWVPIYMPPAVLVACLLLPALTVFGMTLLKAQSREPRTNQP